MYCSTWRRWRSTPAEYCYTGYQQSTKHIFDSIYTTLIVQLCWDEGSGWWAAADPGQWRWWWQCVCGDQCCTWLDQDTCLCTPHHQPVWPTKDSHSTYLQKQSRHHQAAVCDDDDDGGGGVKVSHNWWQLSLDLAAVYISISRNPTNYPWLCICLNGYYSPFP